jgi:hypothetical protein
MHGVSRLMGAKAQDVLTRAVEQWEIAPASMVHVRPALMLAGQMERIRGSEFGSVEEVLRDFRGGFDSQQAPTFGYRLSNVLLMDGILHSGSTARHLRPGAGRRPLGLAPREACRAAMYESWVGNRWFGNWLSDDCLTYRLAENAGVPMATMVPKGHRPSYERRLAITPVRTRATLFDELILFDDRSHNAHKRARADDMRSRLAGSGPRRHPGVFLLRGATGEKRVLRNERAIADHLAARHGFTVLDPTTAALDKIVAACGGASVVAGVEGSHLVHGLVMMPPDARALVIQPPSRAVAVLKLLTDRQEQDYSLVVGMGGDDDAFHADIDEISRTLDLA